VWFCMSVCVNVHVCMYIYICLSNRVTLVRYRDRLVQNPPVKFYQDYYTCHNDPRSTMQSAMGVAAGNTSLVIPFVLAVFLPLVFLLLRCADKVPLEELYDEDDEATAAKVLTGMLLRLRDKRASGLLKDGILSAWYAELTDSAKSSMYHELVDVIPPESSNAHTHTHTHARRPDNDQSENHSSFMVVESDDAVDYKHIYVEEQKK
jgi:hypothetical protein